MELRYEIESGWPSRLNLRRRISAHTRVDRVARFKVGITSNPEARQYAYTRDYDEMILLHETSSERLVRETERQLVEYYGDDSDAERGGGGGRLGKQPFYVYVAVALL